jgi:hypothetical protein
MPNGRPGDHPLTDMLVHQRHPFPEDMEEMLLEILKFDSNFPDGKRYYIEQVKWENCFFDWEKGENLEEGRNALKKVLTELKSTQ